MTRVTLFLVAFVAAFFLAGCSKPIHTGMNFGEIRSVVRLEFAIGMETREVLAGLDRLKIRHWQAWNLSDEDKPGISASVPSEKKFRLNLTNRGQGILSVWFDEQDRLKFVEYLPPFYDRKRHGGWWPDEPVVLIGVDQ